MMILLTKHTVNDQNGLGAYDVNGHKSNHCMSSLPTSV